MLNGLCSVETFFTSCLERCLSFSNVFVVSIFSLCFQCNSHFLSTGFSTWRIPYSSIFLRKLYRLMYLIDAFERFSISLSWGFVSVFGRLMGRKVVRCSYKKTRIIPPFLVALLRVLSIQSVLCYSINYCCIA